MSRSADLPRRHADLGYEIGLDQALRDWLAGAALESVWPALDDWIGSHVLHCST